MIRRLSRKVPALLVLALVAVAAAPLGACPVCFGENDSLMAAGLNSGVWVLLAVTGVVLACFSALFFTIWRRIVRHERRVGQLRALVLANNEKREN